MSVDRLQHHFSCVKMPRSSGRRANFLRGHAGHHRSDLCGRCPSVVKTITWDPPCRRLRSAIAAEKRARTGNAWMTLVTTTVMKPVTMTSIVMILDQMTTTTAMTPSAVTLPCRPRRSAVAVPVALQSLKSRKRTSRFFAALLAPSEARADRSSTSQLNMDTLF